MLGSAFARLARHRLALLAALVLAVGLAVVAAPIGAAPKGANLSLVAYSTPKDAYADLIPAFQATSAGQGLTFTQSYGASGDQARAVAAGLAADVVNLSLSPDIATLVAPASCAATGTASLRRHGHELDRGLRRAQGQPQAHQDLERPGQAGRQRDHAEPVHVGRRALERHGRLRGAARDRPHAKQATAYLNALFHHVAVQDKSARDALQTFVGGKGDVMLAYESEAIGAQQKGASISYVVPRNTILIQNPIAVTSFSGHQTEAKAFVSFLLSPKGQTIWAKHGYRPVVPSVLKRSHFPTPKGLFKITQFGLGGWPAVNSKFFDPQSGIVAKIEAGL